MSVNPKYPGTARLIHLEVPTNSSQIALMGPAPSPFHPDVLRISGILVYNPSGNIVPLEVWGVYDPGGLAVAVPLFQGSVPAGAGYLAASPYDFLAAWGGSQTSHRAEDLGKLYDNTQALTFWNKQILVGSDVRVLLSYQAFVGDW